MEERKDFYQVIEEIYAKDNRYKPDSYEFVIQALHFTQSKFKRQTHVTGGELSEGIREYAIEQYGFHGQGGFNSLGHNKNRGLW